MVFIIKIFGLLSSSLLLFPFHNVSADMSSSLLQVFVELGNLQGTSNYVLYWIHGGSPVLIPSAITEYKWFKYSCIVTRCSQDWTCNLQMIVSLERETTPITVMPCVLLDNSKWSLGTYKLSKIHSELSSRTHGVTVIDFCASRILGQSLCCANTIYSYGQINFFPNSQ